MAPIRPGNSHAFWKLASGVSLTSEVDGGWGGEAYFVNETWAAYDASHLHGSDIYRVEVSDVSADFDAVVQALEAAAQRGEETPFIKGYVHWRDDAQQPRTPAALLSSIKQARNRRLFSQDVDLLAYSVANEQLFWRRWRQADWYWANILFEWSFFTGLAVFMVWPALGNHSALRWGLHGGALPLLFLLPMYLGYATLTFTSAGPSGGILYPFLLMLCHGGHANVIDRWILAHIPQVLEPLSTPIGSPVAITGMGLPGPTTAILAGTVSGLLLFVINSGYRHWSKEHS